MKPKKLLRGHFPWWETSFTQTEFFSWEKPGPDGRGEYNFINFMVKKLDREELLEDRFKAAQRQRTMADKLVFEPLTLVQAFERKHVAHKVRGHHRKEWSEEVPVEHFPEVSSKPPCPKQIPYKPQPHTPRKVRPGVVKGEC